MSLQNTPAAERTHIGIFGKRNAGKSSLINALTGQDLAIVSEKKGTTTDPVSKSMELLPLGPVVLIDTPGLDDIGDLGQLRIQKAYQVLNKTDIALLVIDATVGQTKEDSLILEQIKAKQIPYLIVMNKEDLASSQAYDTEVFPVSSTTGKNIFELKEAIAALAKVETTKKYIVGDLIQPKDLVILVVPIDSAAPKGRLILPQQQTLRDILDAHATALVVQATELENTLQSIGKKPVLVITDSQIFQEVSEIVPENIPLTSFSVLFARYKGELHSLVAGSSKLVDLQDGDRILICEGCTHHRQCDDIGTVKLPKWIQHYTKKNLHFEWTSGTDFPLDISNYQLIIHCGGCMLHPREMQHRIHVAQEQGIPITNYGMAIAKMNDILTRSLQIFT